MASHSGTAVGLVWALALVALRAPLAAWPAEMTATLPGGATMAFIWVPPGSFTMGSPAGEPGRSPAEGPQHRVQITQGFWMGKCEITQGQWESVMGSLPLGGNAGRYMNLDPDNAASCVGWYQVHDLLDAVNKPFAGAPFRLPTEAEWEYACRAGATGLWSFGDDASALGEYAWYGPNVLGVGGNWGQKVGTRKPNPWGLHDMHGNVMEWVQDRYGPYSDAAQVDPTGPTAGPFRVVRGGGYGNSDWQTRCAWREYGAPEGAGGTAVGARLVRTAEPASAVGSACWGEVKGGRR
jgi:formylglycine-generating enzyme required for sulfatase activity